MTPCPFHRFKLAFADATIVSDGRIAFPECAVAGGLGQGVRGAFNEHGLMDAQLAPELARIQNEGAGVRIHAASNLVRKDTPANVASGLPRQRRARLVMDALLNDTGPCGTVKRKPR